MGSLGWGPDCLGAWFPLREEAPGLLGLEGLEFFTLGQASSGCREGAGIHPTGGGAVDIPACPPRSPARIPGWSLLVEGGADPGLLCVASDPWPLVFLPVQ